jgi:DNA-binding NarL/FixJ family response regulator
MGCGRRLPMMLHITAEPEPSMNIPIVLAEPHAVARAALAELLTHGGGLDVSVVDELGEALRAVARVAAPVLVVSRRLLPRDATGVRLPALLPAGTRTIVLGLQADPAFALDARRAGAAAYVLIDRADPELRVEVDAAIADARLTTLPLSA